MTSVKLSWGNLLILSRESFLGFGWIGCNQVRKSVGLDWTKLLSTYEAFTAKVAA